MLHLMKFHIFGLLLCITISVHGKDDCMFNGNRCFIGGYQYFPNIGYYKMYDVKTSWGDAWKKCKDEGAHLVVIDNQEEYETVRKMQKAVGEEFLFVGMHDLFKEGIFVTVTGEDLVSSEYLQWDVGQPDHYNHNEHCVMLKPNGLLNDINCYKAYYFVCEHNQDPSYPLLPK